MDHWMDRQANRKMRDIVTLGFSEKLMNETFKVCFFKSKDLKDFLTCESLLSTTGVKIIKNICYITEYSSV